EDSSFDRVIKAHQQGHHGCLSRTARAYDCECLPRFNADVNTIENWPFEILITKLYVNEIYFAMNVLKVARIGTVAEMFLDIENGKDFVQGNIRLLNRLINRRKALDRTKEPADISKKGQQCADGNPPLQHEHSAQR